MAAYGAAKTSSAGEKIWFIGLGDRCYAYV